MTTTTAKRFNPNTSMECTACDSLHHFSESRPVGSRFTIGSRPGAFRHEGQTVSYPTREASTAALVAQHAQESKSAQK